MKKPILPKQWLLPILLVIVLGLCSSSTFAAYQFYNGPQKPDSEVAVLKGESVKIILYRIDSENQYFSSGYNSLGQKLLNLKFDIAMLPGEHEFEFLLGVGKNARMYVLRFELKPGKTYLIDEEKDELVVYLDKKDKDNIISVTRSQTPVYEEPAGPDFATLRIENGLSWFKMKFTVWIHRIDGKMRKVESLFTPPNSFNSFKDGSTNIKLTPGEHAVIASVSGSSILGNSQYVPLNTVTLKGNFEAGKTYTVELTKIGEEPRIIYQVARFIEAPPAPATTK